MKPRVAVLYQALDPPLINGTQKPKKPGGYKDSGADIAFVLSHNPNISVITPCLSPDPLKDEDWVFGDTESGILAAIAHNATHLWANTIIFASHPLQTSEHLSAKSKDLRIVGQPPKAVEIFDDKNFVNDMLRAKGGFRLPNAKLAEHEDELDNIISGLESFPVVAKPVRGRGSFGVKVCHNALDLRLHCLDLLNQQSSVIIEDYLAGQEGTVTVMPPSQNSSNKSRSDYWALPVVERFNHANGVAPYNGVVAVIQNSRLISDHEHHQDPSYREIQRQCIEVARLLQCTAPIRIDIRRLTEDRASPFALFDVNMKPNMTGPGRQGRETQASLTAMAAAGIGWDYSALLSEILESSVTLDDLRNRTVPLTK
ncbi:hypothetical protein BKA66DRAFT_564947 [Pyrenochaeta sp. MPI-SDFR-AT-0127]|nr:hypothetical protein BKA66DRAFT_564947 [Pyrenochaeta sp. MPI-SDFR-AT-0127]